MGGPEFVNYFHKESKPKKNRNFFLGGVVLGGWGGWGGGGEDGWTDEMPKPIRPFNFFEVGGA